MNFQPSSYSLTIGEAKTSKNPTLQTAMQVLRVAGAIAVPVAMATSYYRNKSLPWAFVSGLVAPAYLIYVGIEKVGGK